MWKLTPSLPSLIPKPPRGEGGLESVPYLTCSTIAATIVAVEQVWYSNDIAAVDTFGIPVAMTPDQPPRVVVWE